MKKIKFFILLGLFGMISIGVNAYDFTSVNNGVTIYYNIISSTDLTCEVTHMGQKYNPIKSYSGAVTIPANVTFNGKTYSVTGIGMDAFANCNELSSVEIPTSVTNIANYAFQITSGLASINIPNYVTSIGYHAFYGSGLNSVSIPNSVIDLGEGAFMSCSKLKSITMGNSVTELKDYTFYQCRKLESVTIGNSLSTIGDEVFDSGESGELHLQKLTYASGTKKALYIGIGSTSIVIPNSVIEIDNMVFSYSTESVYISDIDKWAEIKKTGGGVPKDFNLFLNNELVTNAKLKSATKIEDYTFQHCSNLKSIDIPKSVKSIGQRSFAYCSNLTLVKINADSPVSIQTPFDKWSQSYTQFDNSDLSKCKLIVPAGSKTLYCNADIWKEFGTIEEKSAPISFVDDYVNSLCLDNWDTDDDGEFSYEEAAAVKDLGNVFKDKNITSFDELQYFTGLTSISTSSFEGCDELESIKIPNFVKTIGTTAFYQCIKLKSIEIPNSVESIKTEAFASCFNLTSANIPNSVNTIGDFIFRDCYNLESLTVEDGNILYDSRNDCNAIIETATNTLIAGCKNTIIPKSVISIGDGAFSGCRNLSSIEFPIYLKRIGKLSFEYCTALTSIRIGNTVESIGGGAFRNCYNLTSVVIPNTVTTIDDGAFYGCNALTSVTNFSATPQTINDVTFTSYGTLHVLEGYSNVYSATDNWKKFTIVDDIVPNIKITNKNDSYIEDIVMPNSDLSIDDNIKSIEITERISDVNITYTRNFEKAGVWQAWYMPFDVDFDDMKGAYDVAQIHGVLLDKDNNAVLAFLKLDKGTVNANTPYVVRPKKSGEVAITTTTDLQPTQSNSFLMMSATDKYTIGGVYEKTTTPGNWYALNLDGQFQLMGSGVYLRPFRIYMTIDPRTDNPYAQSATTTAKMDIVVIGDDETTGIESLTPALSEGEGAIYNLNGQRVTSIQKGQIYIMNGKKYIAK